VSNHTTLFLSGVGREFLQLIPNVALILYIVILNPCHVTCT
jgi:hypothetical protein